jgi:hypothetical protein
MLQCAYGLAIVGKIVWLGVGCNDFDHYWENGISRPRHGFNIEFYGAFTNEVLDFWAFLRFFCQLQKFAENSDMTCMSIQIFFSKSTWVIITASSWLKNCWWSCEKAHKKVTGKQGKFIQRFSSLCNVGKSFYFRINFWKFSNCFYPAFSNTYSVSRSTFCKLWSHTSTIQLKYDTRL